eukprot:TRINITY_DN11982_c0_g1_i1.p1 TRINITY_DN11982_c0_g1~~TRINITY_DN11982_c0_g1_i1.p1  ORF type:complete len:301 (-),score=29.28 TRINITY_DN11982_c0_g1_i1:705-1607(-)
MSFNQNSGMLDSYADYQPQVDFGTNNSNIPSQNSNGGRGRGRRGRGMLRRDRGQVQGLDQGSPLNTQAMKPHGKTESEGLVPPSARLGRGRGRGRGASRTAVGLQANSEGGKGRGRGRGGTLCARGPRAQDASKKCAQKGLVKAQGEKALKSLLSAEEKVSWIKMRVLPAVVRVRVCQPGATQENTQVTIEDGKIVVQGWVGPNCARFYHSSLLPRDAVAATLGTQFHNDHIIVRIFRRRAQRILLQQGLKSQKGIKAVKNRSSNHKRERVQQRQEVQDRDAAIVDDGFVDVVEDSKLPF